MWGKMQQLFGDISRKQPELSIQLEQQGMKFSTVLCVEVLVRKNGYNMTQVKIIWVNK